MERLAQLGPVDPCAAARGASTRGEMRPVPGDLRGPWEVHVDVGLTSGRVLTNVPLAMEHDQRDAAKPAGPVGRVGAS